MCNHNIQAARGNGFWGDPFSLCREEGIIYVNMHHFTIDDFDPAVVGIAIQTMGGKIAIFKRYREFQES